MELALNLAWLALVTSLTLAWLRTGRGGYSRRRGQFVALAGVALILFPVISITDDYWAAQFQTEADSFVVRNQVDVHQHRIAPEPAWIPPYDGPPITLAIVGRISIRRTGLPARLTPLPAFLYTRPPPGA